MIKEVRYRHNHIKRFHEHPKNVSLLGSSSFFNDIGSEMITPLLPFYITSLGGGGVAIGLLSGLREGLASIWKILGGWFSDLTGKRKIYIFIGYLVSTLFRFMLFLANSWQQIALFVSLERFGKARDPPRDAIISDSVKKTGRAFGFLQMMDTAGGVIGTFIILFLFWKFNPDLKTIILFASIIGALAILPIFFVYEPTTKKTKKSLFVGIKSLNKDLKYFIFVTTIFTLSNFGLYLFLILRAQELFGNFFIAIVMYLFFSISYALFAVPFGNFSDKVGRKKVLFFGYSL
ncbi:MAG: MFS transporter, partial [Candidatus Pacearchaeota archaeon]